MQEKFLQKWSERKFAERSWKTERNEFNHGDRFKGRRDLGRRTVIAESRVKTNYYYFFLRPIGISNSKEKTHRRRDAEPETVLWNLKH